MIKSATSGTMGINCLALLLLASLSTLCASDECELWERLDIVNAATLDNGSVWDPDGQSLYPPDTYWTEGYNDSLVIYGCPCKLDRPCLRKCCDRDEAMDLTSLDCIPHDGSSKWFRPNVTVNEEGLFRVADEDYFTLIYGNYCHGYLLEPDYYPLEDKYYINFNNGTLYIPQKNRSGLGIDDYCLEFFPETNSYLPYVCFKTLGTEDPPPDRCNQLRYIIYPIGMLISILFLLISLSVYILIRDLRNLHGKCLMCHIVSLIVAYVSLAIVQGAGRGLSDNACTVFGFLIYFSLLCSFFWLNIMCVDICIAFSSMRPMGGSAVVRDKKKFILYVLYAWGVPFLIILITVIMEMHPQIPDTYLKPKFKKYCWFESDNSRMAYFVTPVGILVLCNLVLFLITAINICKINRETAMLHRGDSRRHNEKEDKNRLKLYIKLSIVMGVSWAMEIISFLVGGSVCIWLLTDMVNTLQGVFIFFIFVFKKKVKHLLIKRLSPRWPILNKWESRRPEPPSDSTSSSNVSSTATNIKLKKRNAVASPAQSSVP